MALAFTVKIEPQTRFPLIKWEGFSSFVMWLPLAKIQVEYALAETDDSRFDATWYESCLQLNPRPPAVTLSGPTLLRPFLTGLYFDEAQALCQWWEGSTLPTEAQWQKLVEMLQSESADARYITAICAERELHPRARQLVEQVEDLHTGTTPRTLAQQMLLRGGIEEYVYANKTHQHCKVVGTPATVQSFGTTTVINPALGLAKKELGLRLWYPSMRRVRRVQRRKKSWAWYPESTTQAEKGAKA